MDQKTAIDLIKNRITPRRIETAMRYNRSHAFEQEYRLPEGTVQELSDRWGITQSLLQRKKDKK